MLGDANNLPANVQENLLEQAMGDNALRERLPALVALEFGVLPIKLHDDILIVACRPDFPSRNVPALRQLTSATVHPLPFDPRVLFKYLRALARMTGGLNFPTFETPDFLDDPTLVERLATVKVEQGCEADCQLAANKLVVVDIEFHSNLLDLEGPAETPWQPSTSVTIPTSGHQLRIPYRLTTNGKGQNCRVHLDEAPVDDAVLLVRRTVAQEGSTYEPEFGIDGAMVTDLPYVVHPTEVQLTQIDEQGRIRVHVYNDEHWVAPGEERTFSSTYYFLAEGHRYRRTLRVRLRSLLVLEKARIIHDPGDGEFDEQELDRWLRAW